MIQRWNFAGNKKRYMAAISVKQLFFQHIAQTSPAPPAIEIAKAEGCYQWDNSGKKYLDMISGISVANIGHSHPDVIKAVQEQAARYMHVMVYGEFIEGPQVEYASLLTSLLPVSLNNVYFTNSGTEATEGALKLAKRKTGRSKIIAFNKSYHGSTQGALSVLGDEYWRNAFRPLLPDVWHFDYGCKTAVEAIDYNTCCVIVEPVQAESGITEPPPGWLKAIKDQCRQTGALLIIDEIQTGFGRTGSLWAFERENITPDILLLGKALGGGMPLGAFIASQSLMQLLTDNPVLGHITTFGGHPVSCAAGNTALKILLESGCMQAIPEKEKIIQNSLIHPFIRKLTTKGLWAGVHLESEEIAIKALHTCYANGIITDWFLFASDALRIAPPLTITTEELKIGCEKLLEALNSCPD